MEDATPKDILSRMLAATSATTDAALAQAAGVSPQSVSDARRKGKVPLAWAVTIAEKYQVLLDWLVFGTGPMKARETASAPVQDEDATKELQEMKTRVMQLELEREQLLEENKRAWEMRLSRDKDVEHQRKIIDGLLAHLQASTARLDPAAAAPDFVPGAPFVSHTSKECP